MAEFLEQDLTGSRFQRVSLRDATFTDVYLTGARMRDVDLSGAQVRDALFDKTRLRGVELVDVEIAGELQHVVVNGVDIAPLVEAELDRRMPQRVTMRPDGSDGFREAWAILEGLWSGTVERARSFPESSLHLSVDEEYSFIQTLRHLSFASASWLEHAVLGKPAPWHPLDLPWDGAPSWEGLEWDREARPSLDAVLAVRKERQKAVRGVMDELTDERLRSEVVPLGPGWPEDGKAFTVKKCLRVVLKEEWEHRLFAERDLTRLMEGA
jgi:hypothetical protein